MRDVSSNRCRMDIEIDNSTMLTLKYDRFDLELRSIDVIDEISTNYFSLDMCLREEFSRKHDFLRTSGDPIENKQENFCKGDIYRID